MWQAKDRLQDRKKGQSGCAFSIVLILAGVYFVFFPNRYTSLSIFDFFKGEKISSEEIINLDAFSRIPVLRGGRVKPIDSVARNTLLVLRSKRTALDENGNKVPAVHWLINVLFARNKPIN